MIAATPTSTDPGLRRPRKDPTRISAQEHMILIRMKRIDRGQGCHAAVDRIGRSFDDRHQSFSPAQTRRHIRRLRELGEIHFAGQTPDGRNVYLFPERTYRREDVPIDLGRPVDYLRALPSGDSWSTEKAAQILKLSERGEVASRVTLIDEYPVNRQILKSHGEATIRRAIGRLKAAYPTFKNIQSPSALLRHFLNLEIQDQKKRQAAAAAQVATKTPAGPRLPAEVEKQILALLREGRAAEAHKLAAELAAGEPSAASVAGAARPANTPNAKITASSAGAASMPGAGAVRSEPAPTASSARPVVTISGIVEHYLKTKKGADPVATRSYHGQKSASIARLLGSLSVGELTPAELSLYERKRRADRVSERTIREELKVLRQALELGVSAGLVERETVEGLGMPPGRASPRTSRDGSP